MVRHVSGRTLSSAEARSLDAAEGWMAHVLALTRRGGAVADAARARLGGRVPVRAAAPAASGRAAPAASGGRAARAAARLRALAPATCRLLEELAAQRCFVRPLPTGWRLHDLLRDGLCALNASWSRRPSWCRAPHGRWLGGLRPCPRWPCTCLSRRATLRPCRPCSTAKASVGWPRAGTASSSPGWRLARPAPAAREIWRAEACCRSRPRRRAQCSPAAERRRGHDPA